MDSLLPKLFIVIPCYNEESVIPITAPLFLDEITKLTAKGLISSDSRILFVDDGSKDNTWEIIKSLNKEDIHYIGIKQSRNRGHQNAVYAGLMIAKDKCDITISIDCDGQDDIYTMEKMVEAYFEGNEIVYGVRSSRKTDTIFKSSTAKLYYKLLNLLGAKVVYNHSDYRLVSSRVLKEFSNFREVNLFLRGMFPLVGFKSTSVYYERHERMAGESKYTLGKMLHLAFDGITSLSVVPLRLISEMGIVISILSFVGVVWSVLQNFYGHAVEGWASTVCIVCFMGGVQLISMGVIGEYIGKIYLEVKDRPRYIIADNCGKEVESNNK